MRVLTPYSYRDCDGNMVMANPQQQKHLSTRVQARVEVVLDTLPLQAQTRRLNSAQTFDSKGTSFPNEIKHLSVKVPSPSNLLGSQGTSPVFTDNKDAACSFFIWPASSEGNYRPIVSISLECQRQWRLGTKVDGDMNCCLFNLINHLEVIKADSTPEFIAKANSWIASLTEGLKAYHDGLKRLEQDTGLRITKIGFYKRLCRLALHRCNLMDLMLLDDKGVEVWGQSDWLLNIFVDDSLNKIWLRGFNFERWVTEDDILQLYCHHIIGESLDDWDPSDQSLNDLILPLPCNVQSAVTHTNCTAKLGKSLNLVLDLNLLPLDFEFALLAANSSDYAMRQLLSNTVITGKHSLLPFGSRVTFPNVLIGEETTTGLYQIRASVHKFDGNDSVCIIAVDWSVRVQHGMVYFTAPENHPATHGILIQTYFESDSQKHISDDKFLANNHNAQPSGSHLSSNIELEVVHSPKYGTVVGRLFEGIDIQSLLPISREQQRIDSTNYQTIVDRLFPGQTIESLERLSRGELIGLAISLADRLAPGGRGKELLFFKPDLF